MSIIGTAIGGIILDVAGKLAVPAIKKILADKLGGGVGDLAGQVIDVIAGKAGVPAEELPGLPAKELESAIVSAEPDAVELLAKQVESQRLMNETLQSDKDADGPAWTWTWRPAWMWLLAFVWLYAFILRPVANAALGLTIEALDLSVLLAVTGIFTGLYMGGHTVKDIASKWLGK